MLRFASTSEALQYLADYTGYKIKVAEEDWLEDPDFDPDNYGLLMSRLTSIIGNLGFTPKTLGIVDDYPIILYESNSEKRPKILIVSGMHGEEQACPWGLLRFLESNPDLRNCDLSFIPVVNPTGFMKGRRKDEDGRVPNRGYVHYIDQVFQERNDKINEEPTKEDLILIKHINSLKETALDGFLALHEDNENNKYYVFAYGNQKHQIDYNLIELLKSTGGSSFGIVEKEKSSVPGSGAQIENGLVENDYDGSLEDALNHMGVSHSICSETPQGKSIKERIKVNANIIKAFVSYISKA